jgi:hypothetical protein
LVAEEHAMRTLSCLVLVGTALFGQSVAWFGGTFEEAMAEAKERNVPLLVGFNQDGEDANEAILESLYAEAGFVKLTARCVAVIASIHEHPPVQVGKEQRCSRFPAITCMQHRRIETKAREKCWGANPVSTPSHVVLAPDGTEAARLLDLVAAGDIESAFAAVRKKHGLGIGAAEAASARAGEKAFQAALGAADVPAALECLKQVQKAVAGTTWTARAQALEVQLAKLIADALANVQKSVEQGAHAEALRTIAATAALLKDRPELSAWKKLEAEVLKTPAGRAAKAGLEKEARLRPAFEKGRALESRREFAKAAVEYLRVVRDAPRTALAAQATERMQAFAADKDIAAVVGKSLVEHDAELAYQSARALLDGGDAAGGRAALQALSEKFRGTQAAARATKALGGGG